jgi:carbon dioxide concentrating mechanism protein CcmL
MNLARVAGAVVASVKETRLTGMKLLLVEDAGPDGAARGSTAYVAADLVGAGEGELVLVVRGSPAARSLDVPGVPIDAVIVGIVDSIRSDGSLSYEKR